jgi:hypothetical protein
MVSMLGLLRVVNHVTGKLKCQITISNKSDSCAFVYDDIVISGKAVP